MFFSSPWNSDTHRFENNSGSGVVITEWSGSVSLKPYHKGRLLVLGTWFTILRDISPLITNAFKHVQACLYIFIRRLLNNF